MGPNSYFSNQFSTDLALQKKIKREKFAILERF